MLVSVLPQRQIAQGAAGAARGGGGGGLFLDHDGLLRLVEDEGVEAERRARRDEPEREPERDAELRLSHEPDVADRDDGHDGRAAHEGFGLHLRAVRLAPELDRLRVHLDADDGGVLVVGLADERRVHRAHRRLGELLAEPRLGVGDGVRDKVLVERRGPRDELRRRVEVQGEAASVGLAAAKLGREAKGRAQRRGRGGELYEREALGVQRRLDVLAAVGGAREHLGVEGERRGRELGEGHRGWHDAFLDVCC
mmetsp:Transcript_52317/g.117529  ORF Transcript_52317/g.117529 Transcript_52317/m.117529 type:complete len:253 (+) Transcript_52317:130-888(+)